MIARRELLGGSLVASLSGGGAGQQVSEKAIEDIVAAVRELRGVFERQQDFHEITVVRQRLTDYVHAQMKFPDYLEVGTDAWYQVYDWHVRNAQPIVMNRDVQGRYTLQFMATTLVLRPDLAPTHIGTPFDNR
jgi:hypothetical protein